MILLLIIIVILITYVVTSFVNEEKFKETESKLRSEFEWHMTQKGYEYRQHLDEMEVKYDSRLSEKVSQFAERYDELKNQYDNLMKEGRKDAVKRSKSVVSGQVYEQISPLVPGFHYNLKDVRHVGSPLDFLIFNGLYGSNKELEIVFLEIKSGMSVLNANERRVKQAVEAGRVRYDVFHPDIDHEIDEALEASIVPLEFSSEKFALPPSAALLPPVGSETQGPLQLETLKCGHCKRDFEREVVPGRKPLFCPQCRGTG